METFSKIQLRPTSKLPLFPGWRKPENHVKGNVKGNYGVVCGSASGVVVTDYDTYNVPEQNIDLACIKSKHGGDAYIVGTPKGGFHVYHVFEDKHHSWRNITGFLDAIDIRTEGGYVVGEGSRTENGVYQRLNGSPTCITKMPDCIFDPLDEHMAQMKRKPPGTADDSEDFAELEPELEEAGFSNISWRNKYDFDCDQRGKGSQCPLCNAEHRSNHFFVWKNGAGTYFVKNHSNKCQARKLKSTFNFTLDEQAEIESGVEEDYIVTKRKFEETVCMCKNQLLYVVETPEETILVNRPQLLERFQDVWVDKKLFVKSWLDDKNKRCYDKMDFLPSGAPPNVYNLWKGYEVETIPQGEGIIEPFLNLTNALTGGDSEYLLKWIARLFQKPSEKPTTSPLFISEQGTGKNSYWEFVGDMMGNDLFYETADAHNDIFGRFSTAFEKRKLVLIDEADGGTNFANNSKLKAKVTNTTTPVERKGIQGYVIKNFAGVVFLTNSKFPVKVEETDRRYFAYYSEPTYSKDKAFWDNWHKVWSIKPEHKRAVFDYLMGIDISEVDWKADRPMHQVYQEMRQNCLPQEIKWLVTLIEDFPAEWVEKPIKNSHMFDSFARFVSAKYEPCNKKFGRALGLLIDQKGLPGLQKTRDRTGVIWRIDREVVFEWLKDNKYTSQTELEEPVAMTFSNDW